MRRRANLKSFTLITIRITAAATAIPTTPANGKDGPRLVVGTTFPPAPTLDVEDDGDSDAVPVALARLVAISDVELVTASVEDDLGLCVSCGERELLDVGVRDEASASVVPVGDRLGVNAPVMEVDGE